ncbi:hypothetical protein GALMADRAFT_235876 [Galerina marginata CBS 339.88]|uniref:Structure-specific endonuclease subunit SLX4 n=1 Tax=Galerina marginata (strain CBS 339.88) TaxID=685588 RepID=A0A067TX55_GALM3|nr:hypothetical protein GALMADRAFT_235876 [Galerina marginata CBS 339.88]
MLIRKHPTEEIVDDSEPERAETRRQQRKSKSLFTEPKRKASSGTPLAQKVSDIAPVNSIIEISDSDSEPPKTRRAPNKETAISSPPLCVASSSHISNISNIEKPPSPTSRKQRMLHVQPTSIVGSENTSNVAGMTNSHLKLFAYASSATNKKPNARNDAAIVTAILTKDRGPTTRPPVRKAFDLSNSDLGKVSRCVCCDIAWTTRKTAIQKVNHIQSCAKKHAFDDDTVRILIQNQIANHVPQTVTTKLKKLPPEEGVPNNTLLEDVLGDAAPRKKAKRKQVETMLANVSLTRDGILARAQAILSASTPGVEHGIQPAELDDMDVDMPPSTHPFARSGLAQLQGTTARTLFSGTMAPPQQNDMMRPNSSAPPLTFGEGIGTDLIRASKIQKSSPSSPDSSLEKSLNVTSAAKSETPAKTKRPKKTPLKKAHIFDAEWEEHMKKLILQHVDLHCRILRYEPVHFNEFLELAQLYAPPGSKLKSHLRSFLDNQGIHFYEGLTWKR